MEKLELHYYLEGESHSIDAFIKNKSEAELLKLFKEVSDILNLELSFEIEALEQGGIKEFFRVLHKKKNKKQIKKILIFLGIIITNVITNVSSDSLSEDEEYKSLKKQEARLHIKKLEKDLDEENISEDNRTTIINNITFIISNSDKVKFHRSNFYAQLLKENKIEKLSTTELDVNYYPISREKIVERADFKKFVIEKIKIDSEFIENANIEIVSPVFKQSKMKWRGYYDSKPINFNLKDASFKNAVLNRELSFQNGTSIKCLLEFEKEMDDEGNEKITEINVYNVTEIFDGETKIVTKRGKEIKEEKNQTLIDFNDDINQ